MGPSGIVTGASRLTQQLQEHAQALAAQQETDRRTASWSAAAACWKPPSPTCAPSLKGWRKSCARLTSEEQARQQS